MPEPPPGEHCLIQAFEVTVLAWASAFVVIRFAGPSYTPGALTLGRLLVGSAALTTLTLRRRHVRLTGREWALVVVVGVLWFGVYNVSVNAAEHHVDAGTAAMLIQLAPILIGVLAGWCWARASRGCWSSAAWWPSPARW